jgi:hypothetical protein
MYAGIGATTAGQRNDMVGDMADGLGEVALDGAQARLLLPTAMVGAVVLDAERPATGR